MKKGFTVTEILITIGIVGVVAALVLPNMVSKINRSTVGITLARAVELTEKGFGDMLNVARENATRVGIDDPASISTISSLTVNMLNPQDWQDAHNAIDNFNILESNDNHNPLSRVIRSYIGIEPVNNNYTLPNGDANAAVFQFKKLNAYLIFINAGNNNNIADNPDVVIRRIYFDTNGENPPNTFGEDIFLFGLTDSGHLVPAGSQAYTVNLWDDPDHPTVPVLGSDDDQQTCIGSAIPPAVSGGPFNPGDNSSARLSCTARVVRDGWRVNYSY